MTRSYREVYSSFLSIKLDRRLGIGVKLHICYVMYKGLLICFCPSQFESQKWRSIEISTIRWKILNMLQQISTILLCIKITSMATMAYHKLVLQFLWLVLTVNHNVRELYRWIPLISSCNECILHGSNFSSFPNISLDEYSFGKAYCWNEASMSLEAPSVLSSHPGTKHLKIQI